MWRCKHVADALAKYHYWDLPWAKRLGLKTHVHLCLVCGRFHRQVLVDVLRQERHPRRDALHDGHELRAMRFARGEPAES